MLSMFNLPKVELVTFSGDPLKYHEFIKSFDLNVDAVCEGPDRKLSRLMQYTSGSAKEAIRSCQLAGGSQGYSKARELLQTRFGNPHLATEHIISMLKDPKPVKNQAEIQQLADSLESAYMVLCQLNTVSEVDNQYNMLSIVNRLPMYVQIDWEKRVLETKRTT